MTLTKFLLARLAEDEKLLDYGNPLRIHVDPGGNGDATFPFHDRWKAECEAKRRIVRLGVGRVEHDLLMRFLALPYAEHPDYREEWRP